MNKFIKLTSTMPAEKPVYVDPTNIIALKHTNWGDECRIYLANGLCIEVTESVEKVLSLIDNATGDNTIRKLHEYFQEIQTGMSDA